MTEPRVVTLSPAQRACVIELARDGADNDTIAMRLGSNRMSVANHIRQALMRSGHSNRASLAVALVRGELKIRELDRRRRAA